MMQWNWIIRPSDIVSVVRVMSVCELARDQQRKGSILEVDRVGNKFVLKNFRWLIPVIRPSSSLLVKGS